MPDFQPNESLSQATMRTQDLVPTFIDAIQDTAEYAQLVVNNFLIPPYVFDEGDHSAWWDSDDCYHLLEKLFDILCDYTPEGCIFGSHPGDGSDYGFWEIEDTD